MDEMVDILAYLHQYVPMKTSNQVISVPGTEESEVIESEDLHRLLIGGDQLTVERIKGAQSLRKNSTHAAGRLEGFVPVSEDWHAKVCFLQVRMSTKHFSYFHTTVLQCMLHRFCGRGCMARVTPSQSMEHCLNYSR